MHTHTHRPAVPLPCDRLTLQECLETHCFRTAQVLNLVSIISDFICLLFLPTPSLLSLSLSLSLSLHPVYQASYNYHQNEFHQANQKGHIPCEGGGGGARGCPMVHRDGEVCCMDHLMDGGPPYKDGPGQ